MTVAAIIDTLTRVFVMAQETGNESLENDVGDALDSLTGWCSPHRRVDDAKIAALRAALGQMSETPEALPDDYDAARAIHNHVCDLMGQADRASRRTAEHLANIIKRDEARAREVVFPSAGEPATP